MDAERGASGPNNASPRSHHQGWWPVRLLAEVGIVAAEDSETSVAGRAACVGGRSSEG